MSKEYMLAGFREALADVVGAAQETQPGEFPASLEEKMKWLDMRFEDAMDATFSSSGEEL
jgi:hypothetical protein